MYDQLSLPLVIPSEMVFLSITLQEELRIAGFSRSEGIKHVKRLARAHGVPDWPDTKFPSDYQTLIRLVRENSHAQAREPSPGDPCSGLDVTART